MGWELGPEFDQRVRHWPEALSKVSRSWVELGDFGPNLTGVGRSIRKIFSSFGFRGDFQSTCWLM